MTHKPTALWLSAALILPMILRLVLPEADWVTTVELVAMIACAGMPFILGYGGKIDV